MPVTPGAATKLNNLKGIALATTVTAAEKTTYASTVYPAGMWLRDEDGKVVQGDGVKTLAQLFANPLIDPAIAVLTATERAYITNAGQANGFVIADSEGQVPLTQLANYFDENGILKLEAAPVALRQHIKIVADIDARDALDDEEKKGFVFVVDASDDPTVTSGWALYGFTTETTGEPGEEVTTYTPIKVAEGEGLDYDFDNIVNYSRVQAAGAVMYDHTVVMQSPTLAEYAALSAES